jgi:hypothetical protein
MIFKFIIRLAVEMILMDRVIRFFSRNAKPQSFLFPYRVSLYEKAAFYTHPSAESRDTYVYEILKQRWGELFTDFFSGNLKNPEKFYPYFAGAGEGCVARVQGLLSANLWQRAEDLSARCLSLSRASEYLFSEYEGNQDKSVLKIFLEKSKVDTSVLVALRGQASEVTSAAHERNEFLTGLDDHFKKCLSSSQEAFMAVSKGKEALGSVSVGNLEMDLEDLKVYEKKATKARDSGDYKSAWWSGSELCAVGNALVLIVDNSLTYQIDLRHSVGDFGFGEIK